MILLLYLLLLIPPIFITFLAQINIIYNFKRYSRKYANSRITAENAVSVLLRKDGIGNVNVGVVSGELTDCYDTKENTIRLSRDVFGNSSISAIAFAVYLENIVAVAIKGNSAIMSRFKFLRLISLASLIMMLPLVVGIIINMTSLILVSCVVVYGILLFHIINAILEKQLIKSAINKLKDNNFLNEEELKIANEICKAVHLMFIGSTFVQFMKIIENVSNSKMMSDSK